MDRLLDIKNVSAGYQDLKVLHNISMFINEGEVVSLVGSNGAGKTTLLRIISGLVPVTQGEIYFEGKPLLSMKPYERAGIGISHIPQGRGILSKLTVKENLELGAYEKRARSNRDKNMEFAFCTFPRLKERISQAAGSLSGGEQQMLAIARSLMMEPKIIIMDEPSLGLAPIVVDEVFQIISNVANQGISILIVEQNLVRALSVAKRGYVLENGYLVKEGSSEELINDPAVKSAYLGI